MSERMGRTLTAMIGIAAALIVLTMFEQRKAVSAPDDWVATGTPAPQQHAAPRLLNSRWRMAEGTTWQPESAVDQVFFRVYLSPDAELSVRPAGAAEGMAFSLRKGLPPKGAALTPNDTSSTCEGTLPVVTGENYPLVFARTEGGILLSSGDHKMACSAPLVVPELHVVSGSVELASIGTDGKAAGLPLSMSDWLGGVALVGFLWMVLLELELWRGMAWPVTLITGAPTLLGSALLFWAPTAVVGGIRASMGCLLATGVLKLLALGVVRQSVPAHEE